MGSGPSGCWCCGGWWTAWKASGCVSWRAWTPGARLGPTTAPRPPPPPAGCEVGSTWAPAPPPAPCGPPKPCPPAPHHNRPGPMRRPALGRPRRRAGPRHPRPPDHTTVEAEPVLVAAARRLDPPGYDGPSATCTWWPTPTAPTATPNANTSNAGCGWPPPWEGMVALPGLLDPEAGQTLLAALAPWPAP